ncbi:MAG: HD domain-containing protein [Lachnospiraceae bacterium]|nr:HD domain-containing protein [Lachnospiraceae bacterium]
MDYSAVDSSRFTGPVQAAFLMAQQAHQGQTDKAGCPYIAHVCRVASALEDPELQIIALLHDTLEDTALPADEIRRQFGDRIADAVQALTRHRDGHESYEDYIRRVSLNPLARQVKLSDLADNMRLDRLPQVTETDRKRCRKYQKAQDFLLS